MNKNILKKKVKLRLNLFKNERVLLHFWYQNYDFARESKYMVLQPREKM